MFVEEPVVPEASELVGQLVAATPIPIALGERLYNRWDFRRVLPTGVAVIQPDLSHAGGISETRKIAGWAEAYYIRLATHNPLGPVSSAACPVTPPITVPMARTRLMMLRKLYIAFLRAIWIDYKREYLTGMSPQ